MTSPNDPRDSQIVEWVRRHSAPGEPRFDTDVAWARFQRERGVSGKPSRRGIPVYWRIAAAILVVAAGSATFWRTTHRTAPLIERVAANGQRTTITLADGSRITLNGGSRLRYPDGATRGDRDLYLEGEGFFEVKHDPSRAFRVHARQSVIEDIGTRFNVRAYADAPAVEVVVTEGTVALARDANSSKKLRLSAGEAGLLGASGNPTRMTSASLDRYIGWTKGSLVFENTPLRAAAAEIERWYGVRVVIADSALSARPVVARFHGETADQALAALTLALGARVDRTDSTFTIRPRAER